MVERVPLDLLHRGLADAPRRRVYDAQQTDGILRRSCQLQVRDDVFHFSALIEAESSHDDVLPAISPQCFFDLPRLEVGAIEDRNARARILAKQPFNRIRDEQRFVLGVESRVEP